MKEEELKKLLKRRMNLVLKMFGDGCTRVADGSMSAKVLAGRIQGLNTSAYREPTRRFHED